MNEYNLVNRCDHVVFAGTALGVLRLNSPTVTGSSHSIESVWKDVFFHHLHLTIDVLKRQIKDIFILEHGTAVPISITTRTIASRMTRIRPVRIRRKNTIASTPCFWSRRSVIFA
jgi:hypothetical protein